MKKAFDKLWRDGLFYKLIDKIDNIYWRAIVNYYANSSGKVKINGELSTDFKISDGVKQGGILSPFLFNFYINDLLEECIKANIEAKLGPFNVSIICYCDDITLISSSIHDMNRLLRIRGDYAKDWKLEFSINKCYWTCFGREVFNDAKFTLQN
jgi:retron-type reverse transcriptase